MNQYKTSPTNRLLMLLLLIVPLAVGCGTATEEKAKPPAPPISTVEQGPVRVTAEVTPAEPALSDRPKLVVTIDHEPEVAVKMLPFGERIGEFRVLGEETSLPQVKENRDVVTQTFTLEPLATGRQEVWPVMVDYVDNRPGSDRQTHTFETKPLFVNVTSEITSENPVLGELRPASGLLALPFSYVVVLWSVAGGLVVLLVAIYLVKRHRNKEKIYLAKILTPSEMAAAELNELVSSGLANRDIKEFYVGLTGIVRRFIERTTGVRAPEQTTEEFLREVSRRDNFDPNEGRRLKSFLESADLVKFAAYMPEDEAITRSIDRAKVFIGLDEEEQELEEIQPIS